MEEQYNNITQNQQQIPQQGPTPARPKIAIILALAGVIVAAAVAAYFLLWKGGPADISGGNANKPREEAAGGKTGGAQAAKDKVAEKPLPLRCKSPGEWVYEEYGNRELARDPSAVALESNGNEHIIYEHGERGAGKDTFAGDYKHVVRAKSGWKEASLPESLTVQNSGNLSFYFDGYDTLHILHYDRADRGLKHSFAEKGGRWNSNLIFGGDSSETIDSMKMVTGGDGVSHIFYSYTDDSDIFDRRYEIDYRTASRSGSLSDNATIYEGEAPIRIYGAGVDGSGMPHVIFASGTYGNGQSELKYATLKNGSWNIENAYGMSQTVLDSNWFFTVTADGVPHIAFIKRNRQKLFGSAQLLHIERQSGGNWVTDTVDTVKGIDSVELFNKYADGGLYIVYDFLPYEEKYAYRAPGSSSYKVESIQGYFNSDSSNDFKFVDSVSDKNGGIYAVLSSYDLSAGSVLFNAYRCP